ncbi:hypothetical protein SAMN02745121_01793 [Nannocystis exedens]|uniref:DoxX protein n=1 Tax=Nannocystis exedens TaxID=54 RepID=A0A1I1VMK6_9BACT|nr:hypothetical protein [Nannocystis exedens]PCC72678.1 hypothetical protein NAEX_05761 [Nannocystis exedens]SFD84257.1 hypothetical protein SAMN02745121_01793 [Nannocystis exedens]
MDRTTARWSPARRLGFLFLAFYLLFNIVPHALGSVPAIGELFLDVWLALWGALMPVLGNAALGIEGPIEVIQTGSGDMTWNYVQQFWFVVVAAAVAGAWTAIDRGRRDHATFYAWLRIAVRYSLALAMFSYGLAKWSGNQFQPPDALRLGETFGDASPMGLAWTFMGFSPAYCWFTGLAEVLAGALLVWRRTATLGGLLAGAVMANVVMINFCFDVPVKLYSSLLLLMAVVVVAHDAPRLLAVLVRNTPAPPADLSAPVLGPKLRAARVVAKALFLLLVPVSFVMQRAAVAEMMAMASYGPLYGLWEVESFSRDGAVRPADPNDGLRWRQLFVGEFPYALVRPMTGEREFFGFATDPAAGTITLSEHGEPPVEHVLQFAQPAPDVLELTGKFGEAAIAARVRKVDLDHTELMTRGFRWVSERPHNR